MSQRPGFFYRLIERFHSFGYTGGSAPPAAVRLLAASDQSGSLKSWVLSLRGCNNKGPFPSASVSRTSGVRAPFLARCRRCTQTDDQSGTRAAYSRILRLLPAFASLTIRLRADKGARFSRGVERLCQTCGPSKCTGGPS